MKLGVMADIHGNFEAFKACYEYLEKRGVDTYVFLGDYSGELPCPEKTMSLIHEIIGKKKTYLIKGNKEEYLEEGVGAPHPEWDVYKSVLGMLRYAYNRVDEADKKFLCALPITDRIEIDGYPAIRICHGWKESTKQKFLPDYGEKNREMLAEISEDIILTAHSHTQFFVSEFGKRVMNPGSVGVVLDGSKKTQCMILHGENGEWNPEFLLLTYDLEAEKRSMEEEHLSDIAPAWTLLTKKMLEGYRVYHGRALSFAMNRCLKETGVCEWPKIPEDIMMRAVTDYLEGLEQP